MESAEQLKVGAGSPGDCPPLVFALSMAHEPICAYSLRCRLESAGLARREGLRDKLLPPTHVSALVNHRWFDQA